MPGTQPRDPRPKVLCAWRRWIILVDLIPMWIITGANGFIGSAVVADLNVRGLSDLIVVDTIPVGERPHLLSEKKYVQFLHTDQLMSFLRRKPRIHGVVHMGACSSTTETNVELLRQNNTEYTQRLYEYCRDAQLPFIYASSGAVYGDGKKGFDDSMKSGSFAPLNPYGWSKLNFDVWAEKQTATPPRWYGLRFFNVFGPNEDHKGEMSSVVYKAFQQIQESGKMRLFKSHRHEYKDGEQLRDFIYVKDIADWVNFLIENKNVKSGIYNMGFGKARTWIDLATSVFKEMNRDLQIEWIDVPSHIRDQYQYLTEARMEKWKAQDGPEPKWSLEAGIQDYVCNYLSKGMHL